MPNQMRACAPFAADGQPSAFAMLVKRHDAALMGTATRVGGGQRAEDVVQEALLRAWEALRTGTRAQHIPGWLHQIAQRGRQSDHSRARTDRPTPRRAR